MKFQVTIIVFVTPFFDAVGKSLFLSLLNIASFVWSLRKLWRNNFSGVV